MKKLLALLAVAGSSIVTFAEGESTGSTGPDFSAATTALTSIQGALTDWVGDALPILVAIGSAFLAFWVVKLVFRLVKSWGNSAK